MKLLQRQRHNGGALTRSRGGSLAPFNDLNRIRDEINRLFENPFSALAPGTSFFEGWTPALDIHEDRDKYTVKAELPGMRKEDINLSLDGNTLIISGERKEEEQKELGETFRTERYFGRFQRSVTLPARVDASKVQAQYQNGVLTVTIPKSEEAKPKQIDVKAS